MKLGFNEATAKGSSDLETDIVLCAEAGFEYIELRLDMIQDYLRRHSVGDIRKLLEENHIRPHALNAIYTYGDLFGEQGQAEKDREFLQGYMAACSLAK